MPSGVEVEDEFWWCNLGVGHRVREFGWPRICRRPRAMGDPLGCIACDSGEDRGDSDIEYRTPLWTLKRQIPLTRIH